METFDAIFQRRAVRRFDTEHEMSNEEIERLIGAAMQSPTSFNIQQWRFVVVRDTELQHRIREAASDQPHVSDASITVVMTADVKAWDRHPERYWRDAPPDTAARLVAWMGPFYEGNDQLQRDEAMRSCGIAGQTLMLAAKDMGYDSCPMIGFEAEKVAEIIRLPADHVISFIIVVGKALEPAGPNPGQLPLREVLIHDQFPKP